MPAGPVISGTVGAIRDTQLRGVPRWFPQCRPETLIPRTVDISPVFIYSVSDWMFVASIAHLK